MQNKPTYSNLWTFEDIRTEWLFHRGTPNRIFVIYEDRLLHFYLMEHYEGTRFKDKVTGKSIAIPKEYMDNVACRFSVEDETVFVTTRRPDAQMYIRWLAHKMNGEMPDKILNGWEPIWKKDE